MASPFGRTFTARSIQKDATTATREDAVLIVPYAGTITAVAVVYDVAMTGADTNSATDSLVNKGSTGAGTTIVATKAYVNAVNAAAFAATPLVVSSTAASVLVAAGDVLALSRTKVGTGITNQPCTVQVTLTALN